MVPFAVFRAKLDFGVSMYKLYMDRNILYNRDVLRIFN